MADPRQKSKKQLSSKQRPLKGFTLYLCHNIDYDDVTEALRRAGIRFQRHRNHFSGSTADTELLRKVGKRRWILITADKKQRTRNIERECIMRHKVREFVLTSSEVGDVGALLVKASGQMRNMCKTNAGPFVATISTSGKVTMRANWQ